MNKFNRRYTARLLRYERWHRITTLFNQFEGLINNYAAASPEEVKALKQIHTELYGCYLVAKDWEEKSKPYDKVR